MSEHNCPKCGSLGKPKQGVSSKTGQPFTIFECTGGCKSDKLNKFGKPYPFSFFPPKEVKQEEPPKKDQEIVSFHSDQYFQFKLGVLEKMIDELDLKMTEVLNILRKS